MRTLRAIFTLALATFGVVTLAPSAARAAAPSSAYRIWTVAGDSTQCTTSPICGDGGSATSGQLSFPQAVTLAPGGDVVFADWGDSEVRMVSPTGVISLLAGGGTSCLSPPQCGDGGAATQAQLTFPDGVAVDSAGNVYIADSGDNEIRRVTPTGIISRVAGTGAPCAQPPSCGDGGPGPSAALNDPRGLAVDRQGNLYIADTGDQEIRKLSPDGTITRVAGTGEACAKPPSCGDGGLALSAQLSFPQAVAVDHSGGLYVADTGDQEIRRVSPLGTINRVAGTGTVCASPPSCGDGAAATSAQLSYPAGVSVDQVGQVFIADTSDNELRMVSPNGTINRVAGTGSACAAPPACGDSQRGPSASLGYPEGLAVDGAGNVYLADTYDNELRWLSATHAGRLTTASGPVALAVLAKGVTATAVTVRYVLGQAAALTLEVTHRHHSQQAATTQAAKGFGELIWDRGFAGRRATRGRYRLTVTATVGSQHASSSVSITL